MAYQLSKREYFLVTVMAVAGALALYYGSKGGIFGTTAEPEELALLGEPPMVHMARLAGGAEDYDPKARNLFQYSAPPRPVQPPRPQPTPVKRTTPVRPDPQPRRQEPVKPPEPQPPKIQFEFIGVLGPKDAKIAVFENRSEEEIMLARLGEVVQKKFRLLEFKYEAVIMGYTEDRFKDKTTELNQKQ